MTGVFLQILLALQVFAIGALTAVAVGHYYRNIKPRKNQAITRTGEEPPQIPESFRQDMLKLAEANFQNAVKSSSVKLQRELEGSGEDINNLLKKLAVEIVDKELGHYHQELSKLLSQAASQLGGVREEIAKHQVELKNQVAKEMETEKQNLIKQMDTRLADAVGSFLSETLQHNIDLGSQSKYLIDQLEQHKAELIKGVSGEN
jgi:F0F1-type ATP synthase membrane subunit b/b'